MANLLSKIRRGSLLLLAGAACLLLAQPGLAQPRLAEEAKKPPKPRGRLELQILPARPFGQGVFLKGNPVEVRLQMTNVGVATLEKKNLPSLLDGLRIDGDKTYMAKAPEGSSLATRRPERLVPGAFYGRTIDLRELFPALLDRTGMYKVRWSSGGAEAIPINLLIHDNSHLRLQTDGGELLIELAWDQAPIGCTSLRSLVRGRRPKGDKPRIFPYEAAQIRPAPNALPWVDLAVPADKVSKNPLPAESTGIAYEAGAVIFADPQPFKGSGRGPSLPAGPALKGVVGHLQILTESVPEWDGPYAYVGRVVRGLERIQAIQSKEGSAPGNPKDKALNELKVEKATFQWIKPKAAAKRARLRGSLSASLSIAQDNILYGFPISAKFLVGNRGDSAVRLAQPLSFLDGLVLLDEDKTSYRPVSEAGTMALPLTGGVIESGEYVGLHFNADPMFKAFSQGGQFALHWSRGGTRRAEAGVTVHVRHHAKITVKNRGTMVIRLFNDETPNTVARFEELVKNKFYTTPEKETIFHFQIDKPDLSLIQAGGLPGNDEHKAAIPAIPLERGRHAFTTGIVGLAHRAGHPDEGTSQFFICRGEAAGLTGRYTPFGKVVDGLDVLRAIEPGDTIEKIELFLRRPELETVPAQGSR